MPIGTGSSVHLARASGRGGAAEGTDLGPDQYQGVGGGRRVEGGRRRWGGGPRSARRPMTALLFPPGGGKAICMGVYDLHRNEGWVSVGIDHDTATFAVQSIRRWWRHMGGRVGRPGFWVLPPMRVEQRGPPGPLEMGNGGLPRGRGLPSPVFNFHPAPASGTKSSIACSRTSP